MPRWSSRCHTRSPTGSCISGRHARAATSGAPLRIPRCSTGVPVPLIADEQRRADRFNRSVYVVGRLQDHAPLASARAELSAVTAALASESPDALAGRTVVALPLRDALLGNMKPIIASLLGA